MPKLTESDNIFNIKDFKGYILQNEPMWRHTTFNAGGPARFYAVPFSEADAEKLIKAASAASLEIFVIGEGSNLLVSDKGIDALVLDTRFLNKLRFFPENNSSNTEMTPYYEYIPEAAGKKRTGVVVIGAGASVSDAEWLTGSAGWEGLDVFYGMPGSAGGAVWMNARCYGKEISGCFEWADILSEDGKKDRYIFKKEDWAYKKSPFQNKKNIIILNTAFRLEPSDTEKVITSMKKNRDDRLKKGHYRKPCAGSAFKNNRSFGAPSGEIIDKCGLKGFRIGGASVSQWHGNIIVNDKGASAAEIKELIDTVIFKVKTETGFTLEPEITFAGDWK